MTARLHHRRARGVPSLPACLVLVLLWLCSASVAAARPPTLTAPRVSARGETAALSVNPRRARSCRLIAAGPRGRRQATRLAGGSSYAVYLSIARRAPRGSWTLRVRCAGHSSRARRMKVSGDTRPTGRLLFVSVSTARLSGSRPDGFTAPRRRQNGVGAPGIGLTPEQTDGRGGGDGGRGARAIEWALAQQGRTDYNGWCLRFVAHAFGQTTSFKTATIGANALGPRDGRKSSLLAPIGSLVWFHWVDPRDGVNYGHVGISLGDGRMVNALDTVRIEQIEGSKYWRSRYRGWTPAPASWPGRPGPAPPADPVPADPLTPPPPAPPAPARKVITVDNRVTNGMSMSQDAIPLRLTTQPWIFCGTRGCNINGTERTSGQTYDAAVCQTTGERTTNGNDHDAADDANPELAESTRYYGVKLPNDTFGYTNEVWIRAADRGGLGLPAC